MCNTSLTSLLLQHQGLSSMFHLLLYSACKDSCVSTSKDFVSVCGGCVVMPEATCVSFIFFFPFQAKFSLVFVLQQTTAVRFFWQRQNIERKQQKTSHFHTKSHVNFHRKKNNLTKSNTNKLVGSYSIISFLENNYLLHTRPFNLHENRIPVKSECEKIFLRFHLFSG